MKDLDYLFIKSKSYEELLKKAYDSGKNLGFNYKQYLLNRCTEFDLLFRQLVSDNDYEIEQSQDKVLSFDDDEDDYDDIFSQSQDKVLSFDDYDDIFSQSQDKVLSFDDDDDIFSQSGVVPLTSHNSFLRESDFMYPRDVREYLNISKSSFRRLTKSKKLIPIGVGFDGTNYYLREDVEALKNR